MYSKVIQCVCMYIYVYTHKFFMFFSILGYYKVLNMVPYSIQQVFFVCLELSLSTAPTWNLVHMIILP